MALNRVREALEERGEAELVASFDEVVAAKKKSIERDNFINVTITTDKHIDKYCKGAGWKGLQDVLDDAGVSLRSFNFLAFGDQSYPTGKMKPIGKKKVLHVVSGRFYDDSINVFKDAKGKFFVALKDIT